MTASPKWAFLLLLSTYGAIVPLTLLSRTRMEDIRTAGKSIWQTIRLLGEDSQALRLILCFIVVAIQFPRTPAPVLRFADDTFYYLEAGWNVWKFGFLTLDGFTATNGVQPLWQVFCAVLAVPFYFINAKTAFPYGLVLLVLLLNVLLAQILFTIAKRLNLAPALALFISVTATCFHPLLISNGMEMTLVAVSIFFLVLFLQQKTCAEEMHPLALALLSFVVLMSRLDTGILLLLIYLAIVPFWGLKKTIVAGVMLTALAAPYLTYNQFTQSSIVPISGQVKRNWNDYDQLSKVGDVLGPLELLNSEMYEAEKDMVQAVIGRGLQHFFSTLTFGIVPYAWDNWVYNKNEVYQKFGSFLLYIVGVALSLWHLRILPIDIKQPQFLVYLLFVSQVLFFAFQMVYYEVFQFQFWDYYATFGYTVFGFIIAYLLVQPLRDLRGGVAGACAAIALVAVSSFEISTRWKDRLTTQESFSRSHLHANYYETAKFLNENTPAEARVGSWSAGVISFYANNPVTNLEGLMGDHQLLVQNERIELAEFIAENKLSYIVQRFPPNILQPGMRPGRPGGIFGHMRVRPLLDYPDAFTLIHHIQTGTHESWIWHVDGRVLTHLLARRAAIFQRIAETAERIPAAATHQWTWRRLSLALPNSSGFAVSGQDLEYKISSPSLAGRDCRVFARVYNSTPSALTAAVATHGQVHPVTIPKADRWQVVQLLDLRLSEAETYTVLGASAEKGLPLAESSKLWFDDFFLVSEENTLAFKASVQELSAFADRPAIKTSVLTEFRPR